MGFLRPIKCSSSFIAFGAYDFSWVSEWVKVAQSCMTLCNTMDCSPPTWNSPGKNAGVGSHSLLQGIFPIQESNLGLLHWRWILYHLNHQQLLNCRWSWAPAHMLYQRSILSTQCAGKDPDHLVGFHASPLRGCWVKMVKNRSVLAPSVMARKFEYYNPDSKMRLLSPPAPRSNLQMAYCHWFPWQNHLLFKDLVCSVLLSQ